MKKNSESPHYLMIEIDTRNKIDVVYEEGLLIYVLVNGLKGCHNDILTNIWDEVYSTDNKTVKSEEKVEMKKERVINEAANDNNPVTKKNLMMQ